MFGVSGARLPVRLYFRLFLFSLFNVFFAVVVVVCFLSARLNSDGITPCGTHKVLPN